MEGVLKEFAQDTSRTFEIGGFHTHIKIILKVSHYPVIHIDPGIQMYCNIM